MAKKLESTFPNMVIVLSAISIVAAFALGFTYTQTKDAIAKMQEKKQIDAIKEVVAEFDNDPSKEKYTVPGLDGVEFYPAKKGGQLVGTAVKTFTDKGYGGRIDIMIGFNEKMDFFNYVILEHKETPGLGTKLKENKFKDQFKGKNPDTFKLQVKKDGGDVDAITAATISSRAFLDAAQKAVDGIKKGGAK